MSTNKPKLPVNHNTAVKAKKPSTLKTRILAGDGTKLATNHNASTKR